MMGAWLTKDFGGCSCALVRDPVKNDVAFEMYRDHSMGCCQPSERPDASADPPIMARNNDKLFFAGGLPTVHPVLLQRSSVMQRKEGTDVDLDLDHVSRQSVVSRRLLSSGPSEEPLDPVPEDTLSPKESTDMQKDWIPTGFVQESGTHRDKSTTEGPDRQSEGSEISSQRLSFTRANSNISGSGSSMGTVSSLVTSGTGLLAKFATATRAGITFSSATKPWSRTSRSSGMTASSSTNSGRDSTKMENGHSGAQPASPKVSGVENGNTEEPSNPEEQEGYTWRQERYVGQWAGKPQGYGRLFSSNGAHQYQGQWSGGQEHGDGILVSSRSGSKVTYRGQFLQGATSGQGAQEWENGSWHQGAYENGCMSGFGKMGLSSGAQYEGHFSDDHFDGDGCMQYGNKSWYEGQWSRDHRVGIGKYHLPDGSEYVGRFQDDMPHGLGSLFRLDGNRYTGQWIDGREHGNGKIVQPDGTVKSGLWTHGHATQWLSRHKLLQL